MFCLFFNLQIGERKKLDITSYSVVYMFWWQVIDWIAVGYDFVDRRLAEAWVKLSSQHNCDCLNEPCKKEYNRHACIVRKRRRHPTECLPLFRIKSVEATEKDIKATAPRTAESRFDEV